MDSSEVILRKSHRRSGVGAAASSSSGNKTPTLALTTEGHGFENHLMNPMMQFGLAMQAMVHQMQGMQTRKTKAIEDIDATKQVTEPAKPVNETPKPQALALEDKPPLEVACPEPVPSASAKPATEAVAEKDDFEPDALNLMFKRPAAKTATLAKAKASPKSKSSNTKPKAKVKTAPKPVLKPAVKKKASGGWYIETRFRETGQVDKHYLAPDGTSYRILKEARKAGFRE